MNKGGRKYLSGREKKEKKMEIGNNTEIAISSRERKRKTGTPTLRKEGREKQMNKKGKEIFSEGGKKIEIGEK